MPAAKQKPAKKIQPRPLLLDIDPRIDLTKPIYEQVLKLTAADKAAEARARKRKRQASAA